jgi:multicomponent Na+:H+ antiporter subunit A
MRITFLVAALALLIPMFKLGIWPQWPNFPELRLWEIGVFVILATGIIQVVFATTRLTAIISLGIQGFSVALIFMLFGAPDLSFTQFMVETLSVVIIALVLTRLQLMKQDRRSTLALLFDGSVAIAVGVGMGALLMNITQAPLDLRLSEFFSTYSASIAHGRNIVNVILVDFRAIDTLGEITVVLITGVAALALIRVKAAPGPKKKTARADAVSAKEAA